MLSHQFSVMTLSYKQKAMASVDLGPVIKYLSQKNPNKFDEWLQWWQMCNESHESNKTY